MADTEQVGQPSHPNQDNKAKRDSPGGPRTSNKRKFPAEFLEWLECPVCLEIMAENPIFSCTKGHNICQKCMGKVQHCPVCKSSLATKARNLFAEKFLAETLQDTPLECTHHGCNFKSLIKDVLVHESVCPLRPVQCPGCVNWTGPINMVSKHNEGGKCMDNVGIDSDGVFTSTLDDLPGPDRTVFDRAVLTRWKPALLFSEPFLKLMGHIMIRREPTGLWKIHAQAMAGKYHTEKFQYTITVYSPDEGRKHLRWSHQGKFLANVRACKKRFGDYLLLQDSQVKELLQGKELLKFDVKITEC